MKEFMKRDEKSKFMKRTHIRCSNNMFLLFFYYYFLASFETQAAEAAINK